MKEKLVSVEIELAKSWFTLSKTLLTVAGFIFLIYSLSFNLGFSLAKTPLEVYLASSGDQNSSLVKELNDFKPELNETLEKLQNQQEILMMVAMSCVMFAFLFWGLGREDLEKILIKNKLKEPKKKLDGKYFFWMSILVASLGIVSGIIKKEWELVIIGSIFVPLSILIWKKNKRLEKGK